MPGHYVYFINYFLFKGDNWKNGGDINRVLLHSDQDARLFQGENLAASSATGNDAGSITSLRDPEWAVRAFYLELQKFDLNNK